jgi:hypothetical protein
VSAAERSLLPEQVHALRAIVARGDAAVKAWDLWKATMHGVSMDPATPQLVPMVYARLRQQGVRDATLDALRPAYMNAWRTNLVLLRHLPVVVDLLRSQNIEAIALKGTAMLGRHYGDDGARILSDLDLLVPEARFADAWRVLEHAGWLPVREHFRNPDTRFNNAVELKGPDGFSVDLHCHVLAEDCSVDADRGFWLRSVQETIHGAVLRTLSPPDLLVMVLAHGTRGRSDVPHLRWIIDAALIIEGGMDWPAFAATAREHGVSGVMHDALAKLREWIDLEVPESVMSELRATPSDPLALVIHSYGDLGHLGLPAIRLRYHWAALSRGVGNRSVLVRLATIPDYLRYWCQVDHVWQVPGVLAIKLLRMVGYRLGLYRYPGLPRQAAAT